MTNRPMQEATFLILTALADGSQHGYGIIGEVSDISQGRVRLRAGTAEAPRLQANARAALQRLNPALGMN